MIELKNVFFGYGSGDVLRDISISFEKGSLTSIIGPNGCGKSTLLKTSIGVLKHRSGEILLDGRSIKSLDRISTARLAAYLPQGRAVPDMTVSQLVLHGRFPHTGYPRRYTSRDREAAASAMETAGVSELAQMPISSLSGGMRQSAYIAMALAQDTGYILLDEPTTYLDIRHQLELMRLLRTLADSEKGVVAVMHDLPMAFSFSDRLALMSGGRITALGSPSELCCGSAVKGVMGVGVIYEGGRYLYDYTGSL